MKTISAQDIKRRGISCVDKDLKNGPVHVISGNELRYVVMSEDQYQEYLICEEVATVTRIKSSLEDVKSNRVTKGTADQLIKELDLGGV